MGKIGFATKKHAKRFLRGIRARGLATAGMDAYRCPFCDLFHLGRRRTT